MRAWRWAAPRQPLNVVLNQFPKSGRRSSYDKVTLVLAKARHGAVPKVTGLPLRKARQRLRKLKLTPHVVGFKDGRRLRVVAQEPNPRVAAAPGMVVELVVGKG